MSPQCVRACEGAPGCPRTRRRVARFHAASPTGPRLFFRRHVANVVFSQCACGRSPGSLVACDSRRRPRPIPRRPVKDAVFSARRIFHRRVLFPRRSSFDERRSNVLSLVRGAGALLETAVSCASHRRVTGCFRFVVTVIPHVDDGRSRFPFTHARKPELHAHASLNPTVTGIVQRCCRRPAWPFDFCNEIVKRRVAFCGCDPRSPRRSVWRCPVALMVSHRVAMPLAKAVQRADRAA